jgi:transposase InsO family protein
MVECVLVHHWTVEMTAERFQVDAKTVRKWRDRFLDEGVDGLQDRSSRPHHSPTRTRRAVHRSVLRLRRRRRWGPDRIAFEVGIAASTVRRILVAEGCARLDRGDRATDRTPVQRYQRDQPGELIHVDVKKIAAIPDGGGWWMHGRANDPYQGHSGAGYRYIHTAIDDRSRIIYSEILTDEQAVTAAAFWERAAAWFAAIDVHCHRVITDNGSCYRSGLWHRACATTGTTVKKTRPRRPQTNGKVERYHRILLEEWAYIRPWASENQRAAAYDRFIHFYNHHRPHGALGWATPISILGDNLPTEHN